MVGIPNSVQYGSNCLAYQRQVEVLHLPRLAAEQRQVVNPWRSVVSSSHQMHVPNQLDSTWLLAVSRPPFMSLQDHRPFIRAPVVAPKHHGVLAFNAVSREVDTVRFNRLQDFIVLKEQKDLPGRCVPGTKPCIVSRLVIEEPSPRYARSRCFQTCRAEWPQVPACP